MNEEATWRPLSELLSALPMAVPHGDLQVRVSGITEDSREVKAGHLFVAYKGVAVDGHRFVEDVIERGAAAVVVEEAAWEGEGGRAKDIRLPFASFPVITVPSGREALAHLCAAWHGFPARRMGMVGVTGTDGKTTTVNLIYRILRAAGHRVGMISTVNAVMGEETVDTGLHTTTPDSPDVQRYLAQMVEAGTTHAVLETTSEGLAQRRMAACDFDVAAVTNITHEHLYAHGTFENYREAKAMLFRGLSSAHRKTGLAKVAVINADDPSYDYLRAIPADHHLSYALRQPADISAADISSSSQALTFTASTPIGDFPVETTLLGRYNVCNCLAAIGVSLAFGAGMEAVQAGIRSLKGISGRMEHIDCGQPFTAIVDFAHTPGALEPALKAVRELTGGRVWVVFGCAGLRDVGKRPMMGEIAARLADYTVLTAEDPRTEPLEEIIAQMALGCESGGAREGENYWRVEDRGEAIRFAIGRAQPGDLVLVTGKGHERSMCLGTTEYPWSDQQTVRGALEEVLARS
jgi:UDP-N-acetylmuramoyl-L-alanyl-D-glutamate--2,6-diaminopimelate ligase